MHIFECSISIKASQETVFDFHTTVENILKITPPGIKVTVIRADTPQKGQEVILRVKQFGFFVSTMQMKFVEFERPHLLSDMQIRGPFKSLFQRRTFTRINENETLLTDRFEYELPFGFLGKLVQRLFVGKIVETMFEFRQRTTKKLIETENAR